MAVVTGTTGADVLNGTINNDTVKGLKGNDTLFGMDGDDILDGAEGNDTLDAGIGDDVMLGGVGLDTLLGGIGNNTLDGGKGADDLRGGDGDDTYFVDNTGDIVTDTSGTDIIQTTVSITLAAGIENAVFLGKSSGSITGNGLNNIITGNGGRNQLFGLGGDDTLDGGIGSDSMAGGTGDDNYIVDNARDIVIENAGEGANDTVTAFVSYTLSAEIETLVLGEGPLGGVPPVNGTGNALANTIFGNSVGNTLDGAGGADLMQGADGDDVYIYDTIGDFANDVIVGGNDTIRSSVSVDLGSDAIGVEHLTLTGTAAINGTGDAGDNTIIGNSGINFLFGLGGDDVLVADINDFINGGADVDTAMVAFSADLAIQPFWSNMENITLTGTAALNAAGDGNANVLTGNTGNNTLSGAGGNDTLDGGGGTGVDTLLGGTGDDLYIVNFITKGLTITELAGEGIDTVQAGITYTLGAELDNLNLVGAANINGTGNAGVNTLSGNTGVNTLDGGAGADTLIGNGGVDFYVVDNAGDTVDGLGTVLASISWDLGVNTTGVDNLTLTGAAAINGTGDDDDNTITGNAGANILSGGKGDDVLVADITDILDGGADEDTAVVAFSANLATQPGWSNIENITLTGKAALNATGDGGNNTLTGNSARNTLDGGGGDDSFVVTRGDVVIGGTGSDTVFADFSYVLAEGGDVENITLTGAKRVNATGNSAVNILTGNDAINTLDGRGGADIMIGGLGGDVFIVDNIGDVVIEAFSPLLETDLVKSSVTYTLGLFLNALTLTGTANINGTGNDQDNIIIGNAGNNTLDGDIGTDTFEGGAGNDAFIVNSSDDIVTDRAGNDTVFAVDIDYTLGEGLENLTFISTAPPRDFSGTGNELKNIITGADNNDNLNGAGGDDTLIGGLGDDTYSVDSARDVVFENINEGQDTVNASVSYTLGHDVEILVLGNVAAPEEGGLTGTGNERDNTITGGNGRDTLRGMSGDDTLNGGGGADKLEGGEGDDTLYMADIGAPDADVLIGGSGADIFYFQASGSILAGGSVPTIRDYSLADGDQIDLTEVLGGFFSAALDDIDDFINVTSNGRLQIDIYGSGGVVDGWITFAHLQGVQGVPGQQVVDFILPP